VIGCGSAGLISAAGAAGLGARVALVERDRMGGDCLNTGCVPSKALLRSARAAHEMRNSLPFGSGAPGGVRVDFAVVMERMRGLQAEIGRNDSVERYRGLGVDVILGNAQFDSPRSIAVGSRRLAFRKAVIATGARATRPAIAGLADAGYLTNESVFGLRALPASMAVLGGGPVGCELAQAFARLGTEVHLIAQGERLLPREDPAAALVLDTALRREGIRVHKQAEVELVERDGSGSRRVRMKTATGIRSLTVQEVLVGIGRSPNVEGLGLKAAGVEFDARSGVHVDDHLRTTNRNVYAAGDVCTNAKFTHMADAMARVAIQNALFFGRARVSALTVPHCTYTDPEIAHVGLHEHEALAAGIEVDTLLEPMDRVDRAVLDGSTEGFVKVLVEHGTDRIVGATIVGEHAGEILAELTLAMTAGIGLRTIARTIHPYPTRSEAVKRIADAYNRTRLTPRVKRMLGVLLAWQR
jgi:pyruvate/2-oxoglutarate dehydrogenase complex dihydrolipoamide dehydrogenase (E3) component